VLSSSLPVKFNDPRQMPPFPSRTFAGHDPVNSLPRGAQMGRRHFRRKRIALLEEELQKSEQRYWHLFDTVQEGVLILDAKTGLIRDVNPFLSKLLEHSAAAFFGKALWEIGLFQDFDASTLAFRELQKKGYVVYKDLAIKTRSGRVIDVEFVGRVFGVGHVKFVQCIIRDITKRKIAERSEEQLRQGRKMESIGRLAGGVAHDFNNLLGVVLGYCEVLEARSDLPDPAVKMIMEIRNAGISAKSLTQRLLAFSRRQIVEPVFLDLNETVSRIETMLTRIIGDDVELVCSLSRDLGTIKADPSQIEQVLMNLAINSRDAMSKGGKITISTTNVDIDEAYALQHPYTVLGPYVMLTVSDTGMGMDRKTQSHIFEPFFTTKAFGEGTGLGLSTVFGIVKQSGGMISVYSELGRGTTFKVHFPRCAEVADVVQELATMPLRGGTETILLVDDATPLRILTKRLLEDCGYTVLDSDDPADALRIAGELRGPLPLMITDVIMPGLSGPALAEKLVAVRPETRVLYTSGYAEDEFDQHGAPGPDSAFLEKPFTRDALVRKVRELLDSPIYSFL
jgi:two-component system cell cycle sensor histidine kinase/response regulator CckA